MVAPGASCTNGQQLTRGEGKSSLNRPEDLPDWRLGILVFRVRRASPSYYIKISCYRNSVPSRVYVLCGIGVGYSSVG